MDNTESTSAKPTTSSDAQASLPAVSSHGETTPTADAHTAALAPCGSHALAEEHANIRTSPTTGASPGMLASTPDKSSKSALTRTRSGMKCKKQPVKRVRVFSRPKRVTVNTSTLSSPLTTLGFTTQLQQQNARSVQERITTDISDSLLGLQISSLSEQPQLHNITSVSAVSNSLVLPNVAINMSDNFQSQQIHFSNNYGSAAVTSSTQRPNDYRSGSNFLFNNAVSTSNFASFPNSFAATNSTFMNGNPASFPNSFAATNSTFMNGNPILSTTAHRPNTHTSAFPYCSPNYSVLGQSVNVHNNFSQPQMGLPSAANTQSFLHNAFPSHQNSPLNNSAADLSLSASQHSARHVISKDLPSFDGKPEEWPIFITNYVQSTERCGFTDQENLIRLQKSLKGSALEAVRGNLMVPSTVPFAIETLRMLCGHPDIIHRSLQLKLRQEPPVRKENLQTLINLALSVQNYRSTLQAIGLSDYLNDPMLLNELVEKLPGDLKLDWGRFRVSLPKANIEVFDGWLFSLATCATQVTPYTPYDAHEELKGKGKNSKHHVFVHDVIESNDNRSNQNNCCPKCSKDHRLWDCSEFTSLQVNDRWAFIKENRLCLRCFRNHYIRRCNSKKKCGVDGCTMAHNPLLHTSNARAVSENRSIPEPAEAKKPLFIHVNEARKSLFRYIPVTLFGKTTSVDVYALMDEGSSCTIMDSEIALKLGLDGPTKALCLQWTGEVTQNDENSKIVSVDIAARETGKRKFHMSNIRTVSRLDVPQQSLYSTDLEKCNQLKDLPLRPYNAVKAQILIGLDNANLSVPLEVRESTEGGLIAVRCRLGWSVYGRHSEGDSSAHCVLHICPCNNNDSVDNEVKKYFSLESVGVKVTPTPVSIEDERASKLMMSTTEYLEAEKRWQTGLVSH